MPPLAQVDIFNVFGEKKTFYGVPWGDKKNPQKYFKISPWLIVVRPRFLASKAVTHVHFVEENIGACTHL